MSHSTDKLIDFRYWIYK